MSEKIGEMTLKVLEKLPLLKKLVNTQFRLKAFVCISVLIASYISFNATYLVVSSIYRYSFIKNADEISDAMSHQILSSMIRLMEKGWTRNELEAFLNSTKSSSSHFAFNVEMYRGESVERDYGKIEQPQMGRNIISAFQTGQDIIYKTDSIIINIYPIKASAECLKCHVSSKPGDVLGVMKVQQDISPAINEAKRKFNLYFFMLLPIPFIMAGVVSTFLNAKIKRSTKFFHQQVTEINSVKDLTRFNNDSVVDTGFTEFNETLREVRTLAGKIRGLAVDKDILEFEIGVLEKFIITSDVVRDWKEQVKSLLLEINKVMTAHALFCIFQVDDEVYDLEIFWEKSPNEMAKSRFEKIVLNKIKLSDRFCGLTDIKVVHNVADSSVYMTDFEESQIELQTKSIILTAPQIGGVVGIGVQSNMAMGNIRSLVIDSILTTLLNVVGSIKAIYKYTKDLEFYATRDPLTNLYNQRMFWELLGYEIGRANRHKYKFCLLVIDLDNFKNINDSYGHSFGDKYINEIGKAIHEVLRQGDILARYGGDEFVCVLSEADEEQGYTAANRMRDSLDNIALLSPDGTKVKATASIGIAIYPDHAEDAKDLFIFADNMMYRAKSEGKNRVILPNQKDVVDVFKMVSERSFILTKAIEQKLLAPHFQPIMNIKTGKIECYEALSRIKTDEGVLGASEFIEIAEKMGVITTLDIILLEKIYEKMKNKNYEGYIFVNLSPKSLVMSDFMPAVMKLTKQYGINHEQIVFEITERDTVKNMNILEKFVDNLKFMGFKFAVDDFGAGFSSFQYIKRFPIDFVKIEGEFIRSMGKDFRDMAIVKTLLVLAREFGIKTIAEYVEHEGIFEGVKEIEIDYAQGYYIGKPSAEWIKQ
jgi:diguanylate cyclase (GGDEF)-like protein